MAKANARGLNKFRFERVLSDLFDSKDHKHNTTIRLNDVESINPQKVYAVFKDIENFIVKRISNYAAGVGSSAWISTTSPIVSALAQRKFFSLVISGELGTSRIRSNKNIPGEVLHPYGEDFGKLVQIVDGSVLNCFEYIEANVDKNKGIFERLHSKFLVLGDYENGLFIPKETITGSFNFTNNAATGLENVISVICPEVADAYTHVWYQYLLVAAYQRNPSLVTQSDWLTTQLQDERDDAISGMEDDENSSYNFFREERNREADE